MQIRSYVIFDNTIKQIGIKSSIKIKGTESKILPALLIHSWVNKGKHEITRMLLTNLAFDFEGIKIPNEIECSYNDELFRLRQPSENAENIENIVNAEVVHLMSHKRIKLTDKQKRLIIDRLKKDFSDAWDNLNPQMKMNFWDKGITHN